MPKKVLMLLMIAALGVSCSEIHDAGQAAHDGLAAAHDLAADSHALPDEVAALEIVNVRHPSAELLTGGQLSEEQMLTLRDNGYSRFISLRPTDEDGAGWEEEFAARNGIDFVRIPVAGGAGISVENATLLSNALGNEDSRQSVVYCKSGNRVGALLALKAHFVDGATPEDALSFGLEAGLTGAEPLVREKLTAGNDS